MATVTEYASAAAGTSWTTPANANADDGAYATYTIAAKNTTGNVNSLSNFGFDSSIPAGSTINSVTLEVEHKVSTNGGIAFLESAVAIGATVGTYNSDSLEPTTDTARTYSMARPGGGSWTRADLLDATFTVKLRARSGNSATSVVYSWDYARVVVDYTPQNFTLTAQAGSYSLAGQSATITRSRALTASAGSYSLSGQSATLVKGRVLAAQAGSYALSGQSAGITYTPTVGYTLTAQAGSYSLSGQDATLTRSRLLSADAGAYGIGGQSAGVLRSYVLTCEAGSYAIGGADAAITWTQPSQGGWLFRRVPRFHIDGDEGRRYFDTEAEAISALRDLRKDEKTKPKRLRKTYRLVQSPQPEKAAPRPAIAAVEPEKHRPIVTHDEEDEELLLLFA